MLRRGLAVILLASLMVGAAYGIAEPRELPYPPLSTRPTDMAIDDDGFIWLALPSEELVARYDPSSEALNLVRLPFGADRLVYSGGVLLAYARGGDEAVLIEASARPATITLRPGLGIEYAAPSPDGFWLLSSLGDELIQVSRLGEVTRRLEVSVFASEQPISESGGYLWVVTGEGMSLMRVELDGGSEVLVDVGVRIISIASYSSEEVWVSTVDDKLRLYSISGLLREVEMRSGANAGARLFALSDGRLYHVSPSIGIVTEIDGEAKTEKTLRPAVPRLSSLRAGVLYYIDPSGRILGYLHTSRPPVIELGEVRVEGGSSIIVEARVMDKDGDLKEGYPRVLVRQTGLRDKAVEMQLREGDRYVAEVEVEIESGEVQLVIEAIDEGENQALQYVERYQVSGGAIKTGEEEEPTPTETAPREEVEGAVQSSLMLLLVEIALSGAMIAAIIALALRHGRRHRRRRRGLRGRGA